MPPKKDVSISKIMSKKIKEFREKNYPDHGGLKKCAAEFGVSSQMWSNWEARRNNPTDENQRKLADFMGVPVPVLRGEWSPAGQTLITETLRQDLSSSLGVEISHDEVLEIATRMVVRLINRNGGVNMTEEEFISGLTELLSSHKDKGITGLPESQKTDIQGIMDLVDASNAINHAMYEFITLVGQGALLSEEVVPVFREMIATLRQHRTSLKSKPRKSG